MYDEDDTVELSLEEDNACIETLRYADDGTLTVVEHQLLPKGIAVPGPNVLPSILPPWPVKDHQKKWREEHPDETGLGQNGQRVARLEVVVIGQIWSFNAVVEHSLDCWKSIAGNTKRSRSIRMPSRS